MVVGNYLSNSPNFSLSNPNPIAIFVASLFVRRSYTDSSMRSKADAFRVTNTQGGRQGPERLWELSQVFSDAVRQSLPSRGLSSSDGDWLAGY